MTRATTFQAVLFPASHRCKQGWGGGGEKVLGLLLFTLDGGEDRKGGMGDKRRRKSNKGGAYVVKRELPIYGSVLLSK